jgi:hypothetical protein
MKPLLALAAFVLVGCSGSPVDGVFNLPAGKFQGSGGGSNGAGQNNAQDAAICEIPSQVGVTGTVGGQAFAAKDAIEVFDSDTTGYTITISDYANACSYGSTGHAGGTTISITSTGTVLSSGMLDVGSTPTLIVKQDVYDTTCKATTTTAATAGTVMLDKLYECGAVGSFDVMFGSEHVTGTFTASVCAVAGVPACR